MNYQSDNILITASSNLQTGQIDEDDISRAPEEFRESLEDFAAIASELLGASEMSWDLLFSKVGEQRGGPSLDNIVFISSANLYVAQREAEEGRSCQLGIASREQSVGFVLAQTRSKNAAARE